MKCHKLEDSIYCTDAWLLYDIKDLKDKNYIKLMQKYDKDWKGHNTNSAASVQTVQNITTGQNRYFVVIPRKPEDVTISQYVALIAHEILHLTYSALTDIGLLLYLDSQEAYTYFQQAMLQQTINLVLPKFKRKFLL